MNLGAHDKVAQAPPHSFKLTLLENSQQRNLSFRGKLADFIEKVRAAVRQFKAPLAPQHGAGEGSFLVPKQFRCHQHRWD